MLLQKELYWWSGEKKVQVGTVRTKFLVVCVTKGLSMHPLYAAVNPFVNILVL
jgi:hypothetical protein